MYIHIYIYIYTYIYVYKYIYKALHRQQSLHLGLTQPNLRLFLVSVVFLHEFHIYMCVCIYLPIYLSIYLYIHIYIRPYIANPASASCSSP